MLNVIITGSGSGLGKEIYKALEVDPAREDHENAFNPIGIDKAQEDWVDIQCNVSQKSRCKEAIKKAVAAHGEIDILINCAGINHLSPIEYLREIDLDRVMRVNLYSILFMTQACFPSLTERKGTIVNIISNASHIPMTHSFAYNASKGAAEIATKQMARELTKEYGITVFGISPNKLFGTKMSNYIDSTFPLMRGLSYTQGRKYQLKSLLTGQETNPCQIASILPHLLKDKYYHEFLSGCILPMGL